MHTSDFYLSLALIFFVNLAAHFAPTFRKPLADAESYVKSYLFGCGSILICAGIWSWLTDAGAYWIGFAAFVAAAGLGCLIGWAIDLYANYRALRSANERDDSGS